MHFDWKISVYHLIVYDQDQIHRHSQPNKLIFEPMIEFTEFVSYINFIWCNKIIYHSFSSLIETIYIIINIIQSLQIQQPYHHYIAIIQFHCKLKYYHLLYDHHNTTDGLHCLCFLRSNVNIKQLHNNWGFLMKKC